ncbi:MAG: MFS transporter, partial [Muribaculaceae bacterium]|nr:MFS transporter [Muribaculaceae bacterium]
MANNSPLAAANQKMTNFRWTICLLLFLATTVNYMDRQVLSLTWKEFISPEFHWTDANYGLITAVFSIVYAIANLIAGRFIDWMGTKKGYLWAIGVWSAGACAHALCGIATEGYFEIFKGVDLKNASALIEASGDIADARDTVSVWFF